MKKAILEVPGRFCADSSLEKSALSRILMLISQQHPSRRRVNTVRTPISVEKLRIVQGSIHPNVMATRPDSRKSSRSFQRSSASVRTICQYRPDASQSSRRIRFSFVSIFIGYILDKTKTLYVMITF